MFTDLRQGLRSLLKAPGFAFVVVAVLALGIGANTAIFSVVDGVLLKPLPFADASRLVAVHSTVHNEPTDTSYPDFADWRSAATTLDRLAAYATIAVTLTGAGDATSLNTVIVNADLLSMLGVSPINGRLFRADDDARGAVRTAILSEPLWRARFSADPGIVGRNITLDGDPYVVIAVMPKEFAFPLDTEEPVDLWIPIMTSRFGAQWAEQRGASFLSAIGHLRPGATVQSAQAELAAVEGRLNADHPGEHSVPRGIVVRPLREVLVKNYRLGLVVVLGAVAAVLLIACANIANLLLARGTSRRREIAVRAALGATRGRVARQLLIESLMLAAIGGTAGLLLAIWGLDLLVRLSPLQIPRLHSARIDSGVLLFTALASALTGVLCGLVPAFQLSRSNPGDSLKDGDRGGTNAQGARTRHALVVAEMALSVVLLASAGLLVRSFVALQHVDPGFVTERALAMEIQLSQTRYTTGTSMIGFYRRLQNELRALPGVSASALTSTLPLSGGDIGIGFTIEGRSVEPGSRTAATFYGVSPDYFATMGIPFIKGRRFTDHDDEKAPLVMVVNETLAAKYWPGEDAIGKRITLGYNDSGPREIVGIVGDVKRGSLSEVREPQTYTPFPQAPFPFVSAVVRTTASPEAAGGSLRAALARLDSEQAASKITTLDAYVRRSVATPRFTALLTAAFATVAVLLAGFGLYGVMAFSVAQRQREIGIRMALGAQPRDVRSLVVVHAMKMAAIGLAIGLAGALAIARVIGSLLFNVGADDPATFASVCVLLVGVMIAAAYLPARRATRVDPIVALRGD